MGEEISKEVLELENEEDIYNVEFRQQLLEDDEISMEEEAFMRGYNEEG